MFYIFAVTLKKKKEDKALDVVVEMLLNHSVRYIVPIPTYAFWINIRIGLTKVNDKLKIEF